MTLNKKILAAAIAGGLFATAAQAQVNLSATAALSNPTLYASEIIAGTGVGGAPSAVTLAAIAENEIRVSLNRNMVAGEVLYARIECSPNYRIAAPGAVTVTRRFSDVAVGAGAVGDETAATLGSAAANATLGAINGAGTNAINFSITATTGGINAPNNLRIAGTRTLTAASNAGCTYSLYDQASQAANGGELGRITTSGERPVASFASGLALRIVTPTDRIASVEASPSFGAFLLPVGQTASLGRVLFGLRNAVSTLAADTNILAQPRLADGTNGYAAGVLLAGTSNHVVTGDFSLAANADGTFTGDALPRVAFRASADCLAGVVANASTLTATTATFATGAGAVDGFLCLTGRVGNLIAASTYSHVFNAISATPATYAVTNLGPVSYGSITRNGTELQAPLVQNPSGWFSRIALTNTSSVARPYTFTAIREAGTTWTALPAATGVIPANGTLILLTSEIGTFSGPRGSLNVTVAAGTNTVQGLYQIVNGTTGALSNHVMVRPGSN